MVHAPHSKRQQRRRSSPDEMEAFRTAIIEHVERLESFWPLTVRQVFYVIVSAGLIAKVKTEYRRVQRQLSLLREDGTILWEAITDTGREIMQLACYASPADALDDLAATYSLDPRANQRTVIFIAVEEAGLMQQVWRIATRYGARLVPCRGYSSITALHDAADMIRRTGKPVVWLSVGDLDPSGEDLAQVASATARRYAGDQWKRSSWWHYERVAITEDQADEHELEWHEINTKDPRAAKWDRDGAIEVEALPPAVLAEALRDALNTHTDSAALATIDAEERRHAATLRRIADRLRDDDEEDGKI